VLAQIFPEDTAALIAQATADEESRLFAGVNYRSDITAGDQLGLAVGQKVMERAATDLSNVAGTQAPIPVGPGLWVGMNPVLPGWGGVRPFFLSAGNQLRPVPPPAFDSAEFAAALQEVRQISDTRTAAQLQIAQFWADGAGTFTPPGHWNQIACDLIVQRDLNEIRAARALALMNMAVMDAGIAVWDCKYAYWIIRPSQADPAITLPVGLPNFPSFPSGHSGFSAAAADVLGYIFPDLRDNLRAMADEAALSRLFGGIHFRFDNDAGLVIGRAVAQLAIARGMSDGSP
jgi:membrane-associated phospholipid phosphatase